MNFSGILIGAISFALIGAFHPIVIKCEYHFGVKVWPIFLVCGVICCVVSLVIEETTVSAIAAVLGFTCLWSIHELKEQKKRVAKGWFPVNPKRK